MPLANDDKLHIEVPPEFLPSLADWLNREDDALRSRVRAVRPAPKPGEMGAGIELLTVARVLAARARSSCVRSALGLPSAAPRCRSC